MAPVDDDIGRRQDPPQPGQVGVRGAAGTLRHPVAPRPVDQLVKRDRAVGVDEESGQHTPLAGISNLDQPAPGMRLHLAEYSKLQPHCDHLRPDRGLLCPGYRV
ncbi:hypothetical protein Vau01_095260 [Virgisporangium aurantiacum]|uniref:Uncharacterized protein n=1 Tax=Virgisporangium aurantiacum TaxID=175570 RepID=A0A8J3ZHI6_9ACTN|nr:hypothetical protein Vau01_095260 [Virgisporangium aurantiacum]